MTGGPRVLLLVPARTYRAADFLAAAARMDLALVIGSDGALPLGGHPVIPVRARNPDELASACGSVAAVVAADTSMLVLAAAVAERMGLPHNPDDAVRRAAETVGCPCVVKAVSLSASQGVLRADDQDAAVAAARRIRCAGGRGVPVRSLFWWRNT